MLGAIAEGPDEKLYVARPSSGYIGQINDPNGLWRGM